jgi:protein O-mannosyl-transferase
VTSRSPDSPLWLLLYGLALAATSAFVHGGYDPLLVPPGTPAGLVAVPDLDLSGAEPRTREAIEAARQAVRERAADPDAGPADLSEAYGRLGGLYHVHEISAGAARAYQNARTLDSGHLRWAYLDGWLAQGVGRLEDALDAYEAARTLDPDYRPLDLREGEVLAELNQAAAARKRLEAAVSVPGLEAAAAFRLGQLALQDRDYSAAEAWLRRSLRADPDADMVYGPLAQALRGQGDKAGARAALERRGDRAPLVEDPMVRELEDLDTGARRHFLQGLLAVRDNRFQAGAEAFARGLVEDPENVAARISLARALFLAGHPEETRKHIAKALEHEPRNALALFLVAILHDADGHAQQAREGYESVLDLQPGHPGAAHHLGMLAFREGGWPEAAKLLNQAGEAIPDNVLARVLAIVAEGRAHGESAELATGLVAIIDSHPQHPLPRYTLGRLLSAADDPGIRDVQRGLELAETLVLQGAIPPVYEALALARAAGGDLQGARVALDQAETGYRRSGALLLLPRIEQQRSRIDADRLPAQAWPEDDPVLSAPPAEPRGVFQEYPTPRPF